MRTISIIFAFFLRFEVNGNLFRKPTFENLCIIEAKLENTKIDDFFFRQTLSQSQGSMSVQVFQVFMDRLKKRRIVFDNLD